MNLYISSDLGTPLSGNNVSIHELEALKSLGDDVIQIGRDQINPTSFGLPDNPFLQDYLTINLVSQMDLVSKMKALSQTRLDGKRNHIAHLYAGPFTNTIRYLKALGIKVVLTIDAHDRMESMKEFENLGYEYPYVHVKDDNLWKIYNGAVREADIVICPSKISAHFLKSEGVEENRIRIIPHGIDIPTDCKIGGMPDKFNVGYLGNVGPDKGLRYLIEAWSKLNYKDSSLLFGGTYSQELVPFVNKYAAEGNFHLIGWVENKEDFFNKISVYVQPSVTEAFGIEILEAMSYGIPVIASEGAGASEIVKRYNCGFVVPKRDLSAIADKIDSLKNNPHERIHMGKNGRKAVEKYSWNKIMEEYVNVFSSL